MSSSQDAVGAANELLRSLTGVKPATTHNDTVATPSDTEPSKVPSFPPVYRDYYENDKERAVFKEKYFHLLGEYNSLRANYNKLESESNPKHEALSDVIMMEKNGTIARLMREKTGYQNEISKLKEQFKETLVGHENEISKLREKYNKVVDHSGRMLNDRANEYNRLEEKHHKLGLAHITLIASHDDLKKKMVASNNDNVSKFSETDLCKELTERINTLTESNAQLEAKYEATKESSREKYNQQQATIAQLMNKIRGFIGKAVSEGSVKYFQDIGETTPVSATPVSATPVLGTVVETNGIVGNGHTAGTSGITGNGVTETSHPTGICNRIECSCTPASNAANDEIVSLRAQYSRASKELDEVKDEMASWRTKYKEKKSELSMVYEKITTVRKDLSLVQSSNCTLSNTLSSVESELSATKSELSSVKSELSSVKSELSATKSKLTDTKNVPTSANTTYNWNRSPAYSELAVVKNDLDVAIHALSINEVKFMATNKNLIDALTQNSSLKSELAATKTELSSVTSELSATKTELSSVKSELAATKTELARTSTELYELSSTGNDISAPGDNSETDNNKRREIYSNVKKLNDRINTLNAAGVARSKQYDDLTQQVTRLEVARNEQRTSFILLQEKYDALHKAACYYIDLAASKGSLPGN